MAIRGGLIFLIAFIALSTTAAQLEPGVLEALNELRANPTGYAAFLKQQRRYYRGNLLEIPGQPDLLTQEGVRPLDEAISMLESMRGDVGRVVFTAGLARAAADHVRDTGRRGLIGHTGSDGSDLTKRIARYGTWSGEIGEEISYGIHGAREVIVDLLIDDGVATRGHRKSLLNPRWRHVGIACGPHARYETMCVIDFASSYEAR